jgi:hypothetical protein
MRAKRRPRSSRLFVAIAVVGTLAATSFPAVARAQVTTGPAAKEDLTALEKSLTEQHDALSTSDCATACRALASIRRAADKICALDPGDRCAAGRAKAEDATRRVRDACPECAIATAPPSPAPGKEERAMTKGGSGSKAAESAPAPEMAVQSAPPSESKRGGCAGCAMASATPGDLGGGVLAGLALAFALGRRRRRVRPSS